MKKFVEVLAKVIANFKGKAQFVGVGYEVDARVQKGGRSHTNPLWTKDKNGNDYFPNITKKVQTTLLFGFNYYDAICNRLQNMGLNKEEREKKIAEITEAPKGKKFISKNRFLLSNLDETKMYIRFYIAHNPNIKTEVTYYIDGRKATETEIENGIRPYLPSHTPSRKQEELGILYEGNEIEPRDITIDSIFYCSLLKGGKLLEEAA